MSQGNEQRPPTAIVVTVGNPERERLLPCAYGRRMAIVTVSRARSRNGCCSNGLRTSQDRPAIGSLPCRPQPAWRASCGW